jgi:hypothetical protein
MSARHLLRTRRRLGPLGAMVAIGVAAAYLVTRGPAPTALGVNDRAAVLHAATAQVGELAPVAETLNSRVSATATTRARTSPKSSRLYRFLLLQPDHVTPIRWNPCRAVHYRIALNGLVPPSEVRPVQIAFQAAGKALGGVRFIDEGLTSVTPTTVEDSGRAGVDIVFAFALPGSGPDRSALLTGWEAGRGGFAAAGTAGPDGRVVEHPTHGSVVIDAGKWQMMDRQQRSILYLHEIGHVVGLDHPLDSHQIMSSGAYDLPPHYQKGDLEGLALLGRQAGCTA